MRITSYESGKSSYVDVAVPIPDSTCNNVPGTVCKFILTIFVVVSYGVDAN